MAYRERNISGTSLVRINRMELHNDDGAPRVTFSEEEVLQLGTERLTKPYSQFSADLVGRAAEQFPLINPSTGANLGTARVRDLYILAYSLHLYLAGLRDAGTLYPPGQGL
jgi:hypothetical protein